MNARSRDYIDFHISRDRVPPSNLEILEKRIAKKSHATWLERAGGTREAVNTNADSASLSDEQALEVAELAARTEAHYGWPMDIEWAIQGESLYLLQSRPRRYSDPSRPAGRRALKPGDIPLGRWFGPMALVGIVASPMVALPRQGGAQDQKAVQVDTLDVRDTLYHLSGGGGNTMALIDEINGGVVLIDTKLQGWGEAVMEVVAAVTDLPVTTIINTHASEDHAGSNAEFPDVTEIVAHHNTRSHMRRMAEYAGSRASGLPTTTLTDHFSLLEDLDRIDLYYFGAAHTDGDLVVVFPYKRVAYLGDLFPDKATPIIDTDRGGSGVAFPQTLAKAVAAIDGVDRVITGHGTFPTTYAGRGRREQGADRPWTGWMTWDDLAEYAEFNRAFLTAVETAFGEGQSVDEAAASLKLPERFADYGMEHARANVEAIYEELAAR